MKILQKFVLLILGHSTLCHGGLLNLDYLLNNITESVRPQSVYTLQTGNTLLGYHHPRSNNANTLALQQQIADTQKLYDRLKELNRLKEQHKLQTDLPTGKPEDIIKLIMKEKSEDTTKDQSSNNINNNNINTTTENSHVKEEGKQNKTGEEVKVLKALTKRRFFYQMHPVVPDNERNDEVDVIYYIE